PQNISIVDNGLQNSRAAASTVGISQGITSLMAIHADVVYNDMEGVPLLTNINPRANGTTGNRPNPTFARIDELKNLGYNKYNALDGQPRQCHSADCSQCVPSNAGPRAVSGVAARQQ